MLTRDNYLILSVAHYDFCLFYLENAIPCDSDRPYRGNDQPRLRIVDKLVRIHDFIMLGTLVTRVRAKPTPPTSHRDDSRRRTIHCPQSFSAVVIASIYLFNKGLNRYGSNQAWSAVALLPIPRMGLGAPGCGTKKQARRV